MLNVFNGFEAKKMNPLRKKFLDHFKEIHFWVLLKDLFGGKIPVKKFSEFFFLQDFFKLSVKVFRMPLGKEF